MKERKNKNVLQWILLGLCILEIIFSAWFVIKYIKLNKGDEEQNMYLYFDSQGNLKEQITEPIRAGADNIKIYAFCDQEAEATACFISFEKQDGSYYLKNASTTIEGHVATLDSEKKQIEYDPDRDLKYFAYNTDYLFWEFELPSDIVEVPDGEVSATGTITIEISATVDGATKVMEIVPVVVQNNGRSYIQADEYISLAQWNQIMKWIGDGRFSILSETPSSWLVYKNQVVIITDVDNTTFHLYKVSNLGVQTELSVSAILPAYIKSASVSGNTLTLTKQDNTTLTYTPSLRLEAEYNEETYANIDSAYNLGKTIVCEYTSGQYLQLAKKTSTSYVFNGVISGYFVEATITSANVWSYTEQSNARETVLFTYNVATYAEVIQAISNGKVIRLKYIDSDNQDHYLDLVSHGEVEGVDYITFCDLEYDDSIGITLTSANAWDVVIRNLATKDELKAALTPTTPLTATSTSNKLTFTNVNSKCLYILTGGYCSCLITFYGNTLNQTYKTCGTFIYDSNGSVVTTTLNYKFTSTTTVEIWSGNSDKPLYNGYTYYLTGIKLN